MVQGLADDYRVELRRIAPDATWITDKLPHNFMWIGLIHSVFPRARIIRIVGAIRSIRACHHFLRTQFLRAWLFAGDRSDLVHESPLRARRIMDLWRTVLPADRLLEVDYETFGVPYREANARHPGCVLHGLDSGQGLPAPARTIEEAHRRLEGGGAGAVSRHHHHIRLLIGATAWLCGWVNCGNFCRQRRSHEVIPALCDRRRHR